ncbi:MAG: DUF1015 domain-containing protein [candidate division Zixibacteria bacterium]|nr:DUF1015 domain-containing protein [candidate division Zixibacteria bacterium]
MAGEVASPPYDVLSTEEARAMAADNPNSFLRVNKAELEFDEGVDPYSEQVYRRGKENLTRLIEQGVMVRDAKPSFYLYRLTMTGRSQTGLVALSSVDEYDRGLIKKHEHTRPEKVNDRANHITYLEAQVGPVFVTYKFDLTVDRIFKKITAAPAPTDFTGNDKVRHELWLVDDDADIKAITEAFGALKEFYIADGHHRSQSASEVCRRMKEKNPNHTGREIYNYFLNVIFPDRELRILPYNRVITDLNGMTLEEVLEKASGHFDIRPYAGEVVPARPHQFGLYTDRKWYLGEARPGSFDAASPTRSIDAAILQDNLIGPVFGITNPKTDHRVDFVGGIRGNVELVKLVDSGKFKIAFSLYPTSIEQLLKVADAGEVMPPKSTWFEPKLRSGMVVNLLTE